jgi:MerR family redox-sensitive transcriptional activator SoxR
MAQLTISEVGNRVGLRPSALRYYEEIGILQPPARVGGQRRYDNTALHRLAVIQRARSLGFSLREIRTLLHEFPADAPPAERWTTLARQKLVQLATLMSRIKDRESLLQRQGMCSCKSLDECGRCLIEASVTKP